MLMMVLKVPKTWFIVLKKQFSQGYGMENLSSKLLNGNGKKKLCAGFNNWLLRNFLQ